MSDQADQPFRRTREDHKFENAEDYVELISELIQERGEARVGMLAQRLGVSQVTVSKTLRRLVKDGYVMAEPYRPVFLTPKGRETAVLSKSRHETVVAFLVSLGVPLEVAETDAEGIEHHVSPVTLDAMNRRLQEKGN